MCERIAGELEYALSEALEPARAPESLWYRVDRELTPRPAAPRHTMSRLVLAFGMLVIAVISVGWYLDRPVPQAAPAARPAQISRGEHSCVLCHV